MAHSGFAPDKNNAGYDLGWLNFLSWIKSIVEHGAGWQPPTKRLAPKPYRYYLAVIGRAQAG